MLRIPFFHRAVFAVLALLIIALGYVGWQAIIVRGRQVVRAKIENSGGVRVFKRGDDKRIPWLRRQLGDEAVRVESWPSLMPIPPDEADSLFPEAREIPSHLPRRPLDD